MSDSNKNYNSPGNIRKLTEFFTNQTSINEKNYSNMNKTPNLKEQSIKRKNNPNINNYLCKNNNQVICKSRSKVITKSNKIINKKIIINNKAKSPNTIFFSNTNTNKKTKEKKPNNLQDSKKKSQLKYSKRTVSLPGFLSINNSKLKEKNKTKSSLKQVSKINIKPFINNIGINNNIGNNNNRNNNNIKNKKSIKKGNNKPKNKNFNKRSSNNIIDDTKYINNFPKTYSNIQDNLNNKINISNSINKSSLKVDKICTDEEDNLIEDLEEEEIIVNLKEKKRPTISSNSNININEISKYNESNNKSNNKSNIIEKEIKSINKKRNYYENRNNNNINRKSENSSNLTNNINNNSNFTNSINNGILNNSNINNRSSTNTNTNLNESNNNENSKFNENNSSIKDNNITKEENNSNAKSNTKEKIGPNNFICLALLGQGSFGEVYLVNKKYTNEYYAMKVLDKKKIEQQNIFKYAMTERNVLSIINFPFIVKLNYAFQTKEKLFLLLDYCPGGDLSKQLQIQTRFSELKAKFYICEIALAIGELHKHDIIFRDLKPDNIVIDKEGHAMLTDFGLSKEGVDDKRIAKSFCGSVAYLAPEMLNRSGHGKAVDWYLLGVVFFEMLVGLPPYFSNNQEQIFNNIDSAELIIPNFISKKGQNLIKSLLIKNPMERLGSKNDVEEIKNHPYFDDVDWNKIYNREYMPPPIIRDSNKIKFFGYPQFFFDDNNNKNGDEGTNNNYFDDNNNNNYEGWSFVQNFT